MARIRLPDVALVVAAMLLAAGSARQISIAIAGHHAADRDRQVFAREIERGHGGFGLIYVKVESERHGVRIARACATHTSPVTGRPDYRVCAVIRSGHGPARVIRVDRFSPHGRYVPLGQRHR